MLQKILFFSILKKIQVRNFSKIRFCCFEKICLRKGVTGLELRGKMEPDVFEFILCHLQNKC